MRGTSINNQHTRPKSQCQRSKLRFLVPLAMVLTVALIACGSSAEISKSFTENGKNGDLALDFSITMYQGQDVVGGQDVVFSDLLGERPVVLNFWAGLCPPCRAEMPDLEIFNERFQDRAILLGMDLGQFIGLGTQEDAQDLLNELGVTYPAGFTNDANIVRDYEVLGMPTTVFIGNDGKIFEKWTGALNNEILEEKTLEMLNR